MIGGGPLLAVLDYGIGNLRSAQKALQKVGADARLVTTPAEAAGAAGIVLPGVGAFGACMSALRGSGLDAVALDAVDRGTPFLGICVGMQMLYEGSDEDLDATGLGVLPGRIRRLPDGVKRPQMQWNVLDVRRPDDPLLTGLGPEAWVYFVHSYAAEVDDGNLLATCDYGGPVVSVVGRDRLWATQFHPEKSGATGLAILERFVAHVRVMDLYPSIDLREGRVVRLYQGDFDQETSYGEDPVSVAQRYAAAGAAWIHVVDLDADRGVGSNRDLVVAVGRAVVTRVQSGGGVRDGSLLAEGISRVVVGSAIFDDPGLVGRLAAEHPTGVAVGLDHRDGEVRFHGWESGTGRQLLDVVAELEGESPSSLVVTNIHDDGTLAGPDLDGLRRVVDATGVPVIASGGVGSLDDLRALHDTGVAGVIVGRALYEGAFTIDEAVAACAR